MYISPEEDRKWWTHAAVFNNYIYVYVMYQHNLF
jgi:hypothetical protein